MGPVFGERWDKVDKIQKKQLREQWIGIAALVIAGLAIVISLVKG
jgi:hypothetical protein